MSRSAQEIETQRQKRITEERIPLPKRGIVLTTLGSIALLVSFFLPSAGYHNGEILYPYRAIFLEGYWFRPILPFLYALGLSAFLFKTTGRFGRFGAPLTIWAVHLVLASLIVLADGVVLMTVLLSPKQGFGTSMAALALLCWLPVFVQFVFTWFRKKPFAWKLIRLTWLAATVCALAFAVQLLNVLYDKTIYPMLGLYLALGGSIALIWGSLQAEPQITHKERILGMLSN